MTRLTESRPVRVEVPGDEELAFAAGVLRAEAAAVTGAIARLGPSFSRAVDAVVATVDAGGAVVVSGMGKSGLIGQKISATMASLGLPSHFVHPAEAVHGDLGRIRRQDCLLALSYSGRTDEVVALAAGLRQDGLPVITITRGGDTPLDRLATAALAVGDVEEACPLALTPTSSTTATLAVGDALALAASRRRAFTPDDFARHHPGGWLGDLLRPVTEVLRFVAGKNLPLVSADLAVSAALTEAGRLGRRPGALVLVEHDGTLAGLFTDGDLRRLVLRDPAELARPIRSVMTRSPRTLPATAIVRDAVQMFREHRQDEIPVVDEANRPVGVLDVQDLIALKVVRE